MRETDLRRLIEGSADASYVVNGEGVVVAWNKASEELFGISAERAKGQLCRTLIQGVDECGAVCSENCTVQQAIGRSHPPQSFDLLVRTVEGKKWCDVSVIIAKCDVSTQSYAIHIVRPVDLRKRLEMMVRDFVVSKVNLPADQALSMMSSRTAACDIDLSERELEVLGLLAQGGTSKTIASQLHISLTTVNNHIQHILHKLDAHTRLEAIRRAEHAGLI